MSEVAELNISKKIEKLKNMSVFHLAGLMPQLLSIADTIN